MTALASLMTTGIGSLPLADADEAAGLVLEADLSIPFWPQLPKRQALEGIVPQFAGLVPCVQVDHDSGAATWDATDCYAALEPFYERYLEEDPSAFALGDTAAGFAAFERAAAGRRWPVVKGQVTGPITLTTGIADAAKAPLYGNAELRDAAVKALARTAEWQIKRLRAFATEAVLIFVDEPVLAAYGSSTYVGISEQDVRTLLGEVFDAITTGGGIPGIHVCGNSDWGVVCRTGVEVLNFDAYQYGTTVALYPDDMRTLFARGGRIAWGIVPTTEAVRRETAASLVERLDACFDALTAKGFTKEEIRAQSLLTPSCGAGSLEPDDARRVFDLLRDVREAVQARSR